MYTTSIIHDLLNWYRDHHRDLPWRNTNDPYRIWLSEVMLQQTQVMTVIPYYHRWLHRFPTLKSVANADRETLLKVWEGLGYYQRCRNFHRAAVMIQDKYQGIIPSDYKQFRALPGVGDYTVAAVLSMAFHQSLPVLDGNVKRFLARYFGMRNLSPFNLRRQQSFLEKAIQPVEPGIFNQAIMEVGSRICRPRNPNCDQCPVADTCQARVRGNVETYPQKTKRKTPPHYNVVIGLLWNKERFLITRRAENGHLGGLWELPGGKIEPGETAEMALRREFIEECRVHIVPGSRVGVVRHTYSHFSIRIALFHCFLVNENEPVIPLQPHRWIQPENVNDYPFPKA
ncbi:MAG: A/G-specific adenine glycosylase, partial [FCB group bacterium]|nr:A/G-specific adenine glycosylase [FCB group bacterium]